MNKLEKVLQYVSKNVPYYINYFKTHEKDPLDILSYPIVTKKDYIENGDLMLANGHDKTKLKVQKTSGTTGIPLNIYETYDEYYNQVMPLWRNRKKYYNIRTSSRKLTFYLDRAATKDLEKGYQFEAENELVVGIYDVMDGTKTQYILEVIDIYRPDYIRSTPTAICNFIGACRKNGISYCEYVSYIESQSEFLFDFQREVIKGFFVNASISNQYGCTEVSAVAQEIPNCDGLHVLESNAYVEIYAAGCLITREENVEGELLITGLNSFTMPFVRYKIGDRGRIVTNQCGCKHQIITITAGRANDFIQLPDGRQEHSVLLVKGIDYCNQICNQIIKFKFVQEAIDKFVVYISLKDKSFSDKIKSAFLEYIEGTVIESFKWEIYFVSSEAMEQTKSKFCYFENRIKK